MVKSPQYSLLIFILPFLLTLSTQCKSKSKDSPPPSTQENLFMRCNEPFITITVREDSNLIKVRMLNPEDGADFIIQNFPFVSSTVNMQKNTPTYGFKEKNFGGWYNDSIYLSFYMAYKEVDSAQMCTDDMSGEIFPLKGKIVFGSPRPHNACGAFLE